VLREHLRRSSDQPVVQQWSKALDDVVLALREHLRRRHRALEPQARAPAPPAPAPPAPSTCAAGPMQLHERFAPDSCPEPRSAGFRPGGETGVNTGFARALRVDLHLVYT
jgi:hypothetical protein